MQNEPNLNIYKYRLSKEIKRTYSVFENSNVKKTNPKRTQFEPNCAKNPPKCTKVPKNGQKTAPNYTKIAKKNHLSRSAVRHLHILQISITFTPMVETKKIQIKTRGNCDIIDITSDIHSSVLESGITAGTVTVFNIGSTAGITTIEHEPGLVNYDINAAFEKIAPQNGTYEHEKTWHDDNGHAHVRASLLGPSITVPVVNRDLTLGTWQQIVLIDFDTRPRTRTVICQTMGE